MATVAEEAKGRKFIAQRILIRNMKGEEIFETKPKPSLH